MKKVLFTFAMILIVMVSCTSGKTESPVVTTADSTSVDTTNVTQTKTDSVK